MSVISENRLVDGIQPIRGFVLATTIQHLFATGLYDRISAKPGITLDALAADQGYDPVRLKALLTFLSHEDYLTLHEDGVTLTAKGRDAAEVRPWFEMMIGGYGETFLQVGSRLPVGSPPATRDGAFVALGSCGISMHDALPVVRRLLHDSGREYRSLLDLGCGSGIFLTELARDYPQLRAVGIEPAQAAVDAARAWVENSEAADRIEIKLADAVPFLHSDEVKPDLALLSFVIHEILGQRGEAGVKDLLGALFTNNPDADLVIIDIDHLWWDKARMDHPLARTYYNSYFLLHPYTEQRLEPVGFWEKLFEECGLEVVQRLATDPAMDSTGFCVGWLIRKAAARS